ncbi:hypothetical protein NCER_102071 [Vairimorpha ceranae BRL01]|uniref:Uncharacterized protein n=2 Tax=Vairimorpha ceranae TaxID=40302 RepID=C4VBC2_VAIC1|nr:hypothetical protein AAJ76_3500016718 [Vairimorpha ceranae]EEQ81480.1 hypothetical protein NCER_102071 [Vairimorpha ceranae BRL01]KAF5139971.1 hypothetical protein G9O61_00g018910 [Vairimorpha ceranae]KKO75027.1 hypothetical protein AAJ76_3500016718 [Vairimorpha ceranae]
MNLVVFLLKAINMSELDTFLDLYENTTFAMLSFENSFKTKNLQDHINNIKQYNTTILNNEALIEEKLQLSYDNLKKELYSKAKNLEGIQAFFKTITTEIHNVVKNDSIFKQEDLNITKLQFVVSRNFLFVSREEFNEMKFFLRNYKKKIGQIKKLIKVFDNFIGTLSFLSMTDACYTCVEALNEVINCVGPDDDVLSSCDFVLNKP